MSSKDIKVNEEKLLKLTRTVDSLRLIKLEENKPKVYPFNPNYITDYKGSVLGMTNEEIDRLLAFRKQNKWINSTKQFQEVTGVPDSLLAKISPLFRFPEWVVHVKSSNTNHSNFKRNNPKSKAEKLDLNTATALQLQKINGVGKVLSERIVKFRNKSKGGFIADIQLHDVYGLTPGVIEKITDQFTVETPKEVKKIDLNSASIDNLVTIPHIDYDLAHHIVEQRQLRAGFKSINELTKVKGFPVNKIEIIKLYLHFEKKIDE
jgi:competence ComEA-like helix-hairpin-helix protein